MTQHLNLLDAGLRPRRDRFGALPLALAVLSVFVATAMLAAALQWQAARWQAGATLAPVAAAPPPAARADALRDAELEAARLRALRQQQLRLREALASGAAGSTEGYADWLRALARQAQGSLWITAFAVSAEGGTLELEGRMTDAAALPAYLRRLNTEPRFHGRPFAQLNIRSVGEGAGDGLQVAEFQLRSLPGAPAAGTPQTAPALQATAPAAALPR